MAENDEVVKPVRRALKLKPIKPIETSAAPAESTGAAPAPAAAPAVQEVQQPKPVTPPTPMSLKPIVERKAEEVPAVAPVSEEKKEVSASDPTIKAPVADVQEAETIKLSPADIPTQEQVAEKVEEAATPKAPVQESVIEDTRQTIEAPAEKSKIGLLKPGERSSGKSEDKPAENAPAEKTEAPAKKPAPVKKPRPVYNSDDSVSPVFLVSSIIALLLVLGLAAITYIQYSNIFNGTNIQIPGL